MSWDSDGGRKKQLPDPESWVDLGLWLGGRSFVFKNMMSLSIQFALAGFAGCVEKIWGKAFHPDFRVSA